MDDGEVFLVFNATIKEYGLTDGGIYSSDDIKKIAAEGEQHLAFTTAIDSISRSTKSQNEIRDSLKRKKFSPQAIEITIQKLLGYNYLGDDKYVESFLSFKGERYGRRKLIFDLTTQKGIPKNLVEQLVYEKISDEDELNKAVALATKYLDKEKKKVCNLKEKVWNFLAIRGFENETIRNTMSKLDFENKEEI